MLGAGMASRGMTPTWEEENASDLMIQLAGFVTPDKQRSKATEGNDFMTVSAGTWQTAAAKASQRTEFPVRSSDLTGLSGVSKITNSTVMDAPVVVDEPRSEVPADWWRQKPSKLKGQYMPRAAINKLVTMQYSRDSTAKENWVEERRVRRVREAKEGQSTKLTEEEQAVEEKLWERILDERRCLA